MVVSENNGVAVAASVPVPISLSFSLLSRDRLSDILELVSGWAVRPLSAVAAVCSANKVECTQGQELLPLLVGGRLSPRGRQWHGRGAGPPSCQLCQ